MRTDEQLAAGVGRGSRADVAALVARYRRPLFGFLLLRVGDRALAEDLTQEAFVRALRRISTYRPSSPFKPWLYAIALNLARDHAKRADTRHTESALDLDTTGWIDEGSIEEGIMQDEAGRAVVAGLARLPEHQREAVILRYYHDFSLDEIAQTLGVPVGTVKSRLSLGLARLREWVKESV